MKRISLSELRFSLLDVERAQVALCSSLCPVYQLKEFLSLKSSDQSHIVEEPDSFDDEALKKLVIVSILERNSDNIPQHFILVSLDAVFF